MPRLGKDRNAHRRDEDKVREGLSVHAFQATSGTYLEHTE